MEHEAMNDVSVDDLPPCRICGQASCYGSHPAAAIVRQLVEALEAAKKYFDFWLIDDPEPKPTVRAALTAARAWLEQEAPK